MKTIVAVMLALALAALANVASATATWEHFNADPAYPTREVAIADVPRTLRQAGWPEQVVSLLIEEMKKPGVETHVTNGMRYDFMRSGKSALWRNVLVKFKKPPLEESMEYSAPAEKWVVNWNGSIWAVSIPKVCNNTLGERSGGSTQALATRPFALPPATGTIASCPNVYFLKVNVWERKALKLPGVEQTHAKEELGQNQFAGVPHVSKTHGGQFRKAYATGEVGRSETAHTFRVSLIMTPEAQGGPSDITSEEVLGDVTVTGLYDALKFTRAQIGKWDATRIVSVDDDINSPPRYKKTGVHEVRFFFHLPGTVIGEWESNPVPDCIMNVHMIEK